MFRAVVDVPAEYTLEDASDAWRAIGSVAQFLPSDFPAASAFTISSTAVFLIVEETGATRPSYDKVVSAVDRLQVPV